MMPSLSACIAAKLVDDAFSSADFDLFGQRSPAGIAID
jgi:hypothetical protein